MPTDRRKAPTDPDEDAYEDAWYRALKAKSSKKSSDPKVDRTDAPPTPELPPAPDQFEGDARGR
ncbi:MAG TPA: hypothetical protein VFM40_05955 [Actinomycetota bacterium]|nr:hypothetical protein [Actinomycetota bacterium]